MKRSRAIILEKLESASKNDFSEINFEIDNGFDCPENLLDSFIEKLESVGGKGFIVENSKEFAQKIKELTASRGWNRIYCPDAELNESLLVEGVKLLENEPEQGNYDLSVTKCECLISLTGSVLVSSQSGHGRKIHVTPDVHAVYAGVSQLKPFIKDGLNAIKGNPSWVGLITGPSRTADIEKTLVLGAHGPKELYVFINRNC
jgi:L-lactate dehydrogenase complex protein LldG